jgi:hypothetical protein
MTPQLVLEKMRTPPDGLIEKDGRPVDVREDAAAKEALIRIAQDPKNITVHCVGCGGTCELLQSLCCACGGFVCPSCVRVETDDECDHQPPTLPSGVMDLDRGSGIGCLIERGPRPTAETLTYLQALAIIERYLDKCGDGRLHGRSAVNPGMTKAQALDLLLKAILAHQGDDGDVIAAGGPTRIFLARNILKECGIGD